ncbi:MAG: tetratricopeptide repeat protein [Deltaproteobacteria bacterium]|nr:tetratricopeptide repeat protein [Deltaproteobacteria bacterium]MDQ3301101.1 tetratricopeptide repeat protein [Myxococcota bacterium]
MIAPRSSSLVAFGAAFIVALGLAGRPAVADDGAAQPSAARAHHERAIRHFEAQQYAEAIVEFQAAYQIAPRPELLYGIAQAERLRGNCERAIVAYETYLRTAPKDRQAAAARANIERCRTEPTSSQQQPVAPEPSVSAGGASSTTTPLAMRTTAHESPWYTDPRGGVLTVGGVAVAVGGLLAWRHGRAETREHNRASNYDAFLEHSGERYQQVGVGVMIAGGALLVLGLTRYATRRTHTTIHTAIDARGATWQVAFAF